MIQQAATQFKKGVSGNPTGKVKEQVTEDSPSPAPRDRKKSDEQSTVGQLAKLAKVSHYKAGQAVAVITAVEAGGLPPLTNQTLAPS